MGDRAVVLHIESVILLQKLKGQTKYNTLLIFILNTEKPVFILKKTHIILHSFFKLEHGQAEQHRGFDYEKKKNNKNGNNIKWLKSFSRS